MYKKTGLTYGASSTFSTWSMGGLFKAGFYTKNEKIGEMQIRNGDGIGNLPGRRTIPSLRLALSPRSGSDSRVGIDHDSVFKGRRRKDCPPNLGTAPDEIPRKGFSGLAIHSTWSLNAYLRDQDQNTRLE